MNSSTPSDDRSRLPSELTRTGSLRNPPPRSGSGAVDVEWGQDDFRQAGALGRLRPIRRLHGRRSTAEPSAELQHIADAKGAITTVQGVVSLLLALVLGFLIWTSYGVYSLQQSEAQTLGSRDPSARSGARTLRIPRPIAAVNC